MTTDFAHIDLIPALTSRPAPVPVRIVRRMISRYYLEHAVRVVKVLFSMSPTWSKTLRILCPVCRVRSQPFDYASCGGERVTSDLGIYSAITLDVYDDLLDGVIHVRVLIGYCPRCRSVVWSD